MTATSMYFSILMATRIYRFTYIVLDYFNILNYIYLNEKNIILAGNVVMFYLQYFRNHVVLIFEFLMRFICAINFKSIYYHCLLLLLLLAF